MLVRFSIVRRGGVEVFCYETEKMIENMVDPQLIAGFLEAIQMFSETMRNPIQEIRFANMLLYVHTYRDFTLRLLFEEELDRKEVEKLFDNLSQVIIPIWPKKKTEMFPSFNLFKETVLPLLKSFVQDPLEGIDVPIPTSAKQVSKIALVGLANAGKTSIKKIFFENWTKDMVKGLKATIGVEISQKMLEFLGKRFMIMDYGGQTAFRKQHISRKERWRGISALIYIIDIQDEISFKISFDYLREIWQIVSETNEKQPKLSIFLHKYDIDKRSNLEESVSRCLLLFEEFVPFATFHLTTIEDSSSNIALIKTFYFSLPEIMLRRLFEEGLLDRFEKEVLSEYAEIAQDESYKEVIQELKPKLQKSSILLGMTYGLSFQKSWMSYLMGEWTPSQRLLSARALSLIREGQFLFIKIQDWTDKGYSKEFTTILLDGFLEGILKTFHLSPPEVVEKENHSVTWKLVI